MTNKGAASGKHRGDKKRKAPAKSSPSASSSGPQAKKARVSKPGLAKVEEALPRGRVALTPLEKETQQRAKQRQQADFLFSTKPKPDAAAAAAATSSGSKAKGDHASSKGGKPTNKQPAPLAEGAAEGAKAKPKKKKKAAAVDEDDLFTQKFADKRVTHVAGLTRKAVKAGMVAMGAVREVRGERLLVSLANSLTVVVNQDQVSDVLNRQPDRPPLASLYKPSQLVLCQILPFPPPTPAHPSPPILASLLPSVLNSPLTITNVTEGQLVWGEVESREDHGFVVGVGVGGVVSAFLKHDDAGGRSLVVGQCVWCVVKGVNRRLSTLALSRDLGLEAPVPPSPPLPMSQLRGGLKMRATVTQVFESGVEVQTEGCATTGLVHVTHIPGALRCADHSWQARWEGQTVEARVLYCEPSSRVLHLTLLPHLLALTPFPFPALPALSSVVRNARVCRVERALGVSVVLDAPEPGDAAAPHAADAEGAKGKKGKKDKRDKKGGKEEHAGESDEGAKKHKTKKGDKSEDGLLGFAHLSQISDSRIDLAKKGSSLRSQLHTCRVVGHNHVDGTVAVDFRKSVLESAHLGVQDVGVAHKVKGVVKEVEKFGMVVTLGPKLTALCPPLHLSDVANPQHLQPGKKSLLPKFKAMVGESHEFRVLAVDQARRRVVLTAKRSLVNSQLPAIASYNVEAGTRTHGFVVGVKDAGVVVGFYNGVRGLVSNKALKGNRADQYSLGQVVECTVTKVNTARRHLFLSFDPSAKPGDEDEDENVDMDTPTLKPGDFTPAQVEAVDIDEMVVRVLLPDGTSATLPIAHTADHKHFMDVIPSLLKPGSSLSSLVVLNVGKRSVVVSAKPSLVDAAKAKALPAAFVDLHKGLVTDGYVRGVEEWGLFVGFLGNVSVLVPRKLVSSAVVANLRDEFYVGQSVRVAITAVDTSAEKAIGSLRDKVCSVVTDCRLVRSYFADMLRAHTCLKEDQPNHGFPTKEFGVGEVVEGVVRDVKDFGCVVAFAAHPSVTGLLLNHHTDQELEKDAQVRVVVLDVDPVQGIVDLSALPTLTKHSRDKRRKESPSVMQVVECTVQLAKTHCLVVTLPAHAHCVGFVCVDPPGHRNPPLHSRFAMGDIVHAQVQALPSASSPHLLLSLSTAPTTARAAVRLQPGQVVRATIKTTRAFHTSVVVPLQAAPGHKRQVVKGQVHVTQVREDEGMVGEKLVQQKEVDAVVVDLVKERGRSIPQLSLLPSAIALGQQGSAAEVKAKCAFTNGDVKRGQAMHGVVLRHLREGLRVGLSPAAYGNLHIGLLGEASLGGHEGMKKAFPVGRVITCTVLRPAPNHDGDVCGAVELCLGDKLPVFSPGQAVFGVVTTVTKGRGLGVCVSYSVRGRVHITDISDEGGENPLAKFKPGSLVRASVKAKDKHGTLVLSLRASAVLGDGRVQPKYPPVSSISDIKRGMLLQGFVRDTGSRGCFINLGPGVVGRARLSNLSDGFIPDLPAAFPEAKAVVVRVLSVEGKGNNAKVELSAKPTDVLVGEWRKTITDLKPNMKVKGYVRSVQPYALFVAIKHSDVVGMCHKKEVGDEADPDLKALYAVGDYVKALVLSVDAEKNKVSLSLNPRHFTEADEDDSSDEEEDDDDEAEDGESEGESEGEEGEGEEGEEEEEEGEGEEMEDDEEDDSGSEVALVAEEGESSDDEQEEMLRAMRAQAQDDDDDDDDDDEDEEEDDEDGDEEVEDDDEMEEDAEESDQEEEDGDSDQGVAWDQGDLREEEGAASTTLGAGFSFKDLKFGAGDEQDKGDEDEESDESGDEAENDGDPDAENKSKSKERREKLQKQREKEKLLRQAEESENTLQSADDFEKLLMGAPNSSFVWIRYMAFQLSLSEIDKARQIGRRALKEINFKELKERNNVWVALLNLEMAHGTEESVASVFKEAKANTDGAEISLTMANIYLRHNNPKMAEELLKGMVKQFRDNVTVWLTYMRLLLKNKRSEKAHQLLQRALQALPKREHIQVIARFARLEFELGSKERGRTVMEGIVTNYPKRTDLWSVYLDMEVKFGDHDTARRLFERAISLDLPPRQVKFFFKKFHSFESQHGDEQSVQLVQQKAREYVESVMKE